MMPNREVHAVVDAAPDEVLPIPAASAPSSPEKEVYVFPASQEQSRYWILDQLDGASTASNMAIAFRLEGDAHDEIVARALTALTLRHEALRTTYRMVEGELSQVISEDADFSFEVSDLRTLAAEARAEQAEALIAEHGRVQVDLARGPMLFVRLIHLTDKDHLLAFTLHHIACDGWSNGILVRDFAELYAAFYEGRTPALPELPFQFADFTVWQQEWLETDAASAALAFWKEHVRRDMPALDLPTDQPRSAGKSAAGRIESVLLSPALDARMKSYCRRENVTMHQVLLSAFEGLLSRYTGQTEYLLGSTIANRTQPGMENVVGRFAHPQVLLADVRGNPTCRELLARVSDWSTKAYSHQDLPFSRLMEEFQLDQVGATSQFLQVYFVYQKAFMQPQESGPLKIIPRPSVSGGVNFDMLVSIVDRAEGPRLQVEYNTVLFTRERVRRLVQMYARLLEAIMADDTLRISELPLLSPAEELEMAGAGASPRQGPLTTGSIPEWFDQQADAQLDSEALLGKDGPVSWRDLQSKSLHFAAALASRKIVARGTVALRMDATSNTAAAALALLRLGAVVVPLPAGTTQSEIDLLQSDLKLSMTLADESARKSEPASGRGLTVNALVGNDLLIDIGDPGFLAGIPFPVDALPYPQATETAWLGVRLESGHCQTSAATHEETLAALVSSAQALNLQSGGAVLLFEAPSSADAWIDFLMPMLAGAKTVHAPRPGPSRHDLQAALASLHSRNTLRQPGHSETFVFATAAEWRSLLHGGLTTMPGTHKVVRGTHLAPATALMLAQAPGTAWFLATSSLLPGPFSVAALDARGDENPGADHAADPPEQKLPLVALPGERLSLRDEAGLPVPFGVHGLLEVERGTNARPTGMLAAYTPENGFRLIDAAARTVKLHSYRLRLGEIEDLLAGHPQIAAADAALLPQEDGSSALVAFVSGYTGEAFPVSEVSAFLKANAPAHLASTELVPVQTIVRGIDGSIDALRQRRLDPGEMPAEARPSEAAGPRDELEGKLVAIWEAVLGTKGIGIRTSFFSLGGYSLMIVRLFARINKTLGTSLPITTIFNAPTIEQLADVLRGRTIYSSLVPIQTKGNRPPFFLIHSYLLYDGLRTTLGDGQPFYGLRELDRDESMSLDSRVSSYVNEIRRVQPRGPYYIGGWCAAGPLAVSTARQLADAGEKVDLLVLFDSWRPGYAAELASTRSANPEMNLRPRLRRKWLFHRRKLNQMSAGQKIRYFGAATLHKLRSMRDHFYLRNWALAQQLFTRFNLPLPDFMHNVSLTTMHAVKLYRGAPFPGQITLIRATDAHYIPGADIACGWDTLAQAGVRVLWAPGDHESMFVEPNLTVVGNLLRGMLSEPHLDE